MTNSQHEELKTITSALMSMTFENEIKAISSIESIMNDKLKSMIIKLGIAIEDEQEIVDIILECLPMALKMHKSKETE